MKKIYIITWIMFFLLPVCSIAQTTIAFNGAESAGTTWTTSSNNFTASTTNTGTPAERIKTGSQSWQRSNGTGTLITNAASTAGYTDCFVELWNASISSTTGNGIDNGEGIDIYVSNTTTFGGTPDVRINSTASNVRWGMSGTGNVTTTAGTPVTYNYTSGGTITGTNAKAKIVIDIPDTWTSVYVKIVSVNNDANEIWCVDDIALKGTVAVTNSITTTAITAGTYPVTSGGEAIAVGSGTLNAKGVAWGLSAASIAALPIPGATETEGRWHIAASGTASFTAPLAGVQPGTTIYYRAYYTTASATVLGDIKSYAVPSKGTSLAFWNFGTDGSSYTEAPTSTVLSTAALTPSTGTGYDNNGKDGFIYNGAVRGQALTWDNASNATNFVVHLNTTGYQNLHFRADYLAQTGGTYSLAYSTNGSTYTNITTSGAIPTNMTGHRSPPNAAPAGIAVRILP